MEPGRYHTWEDYEVLDECEYLADQIKEILK